jgi:hypothetical protein
MLMIKSRMNDCRTIAGIFIVFLSLLSVSVSGQNLCVQTLKKAQKEYDEGRLSDVPVTLEGCLKEGFTRDQKLQAYRLLVLTYLFTDEPELAEQNLLKLLNEDPEYTLNPALDPAEFVALYNTYNTSAVISIGLTGGLNQTRVHLQQAYSTDNSNNKATYKPHFGFQAGLSADILLKKKFQLNAGLQLCQKSYEYKNKLFQYTNLDLKETQLWMELPVALKYNFRYKKKLIPYLYAGASVNLFLSSTGNLTRTSDAGNNDASGPNVKLGSLRNRLNYSALVGGGLKYKIGYSYLCLDLRYAYGLKNIVNTSKRYSDSNLIYFYGYLDSDISINNLFVSVGYYKSFYKPKKIKKAIQ